MKWKDIGCIPYYALPVKLGNVISVARPILNLLNTFFLKFWFFNFLNIPQKSKNLPIKINKKDPIVEEQRYTHWHKKITYLDIFFTYRVVDEEGVKTCYLIDFYYTENKRRDKAVLKKALKFIIQSEIIDIIIYVGTLQFQPGYLIRIPFSREPKHLYFMGNVLATDKINEKFVYDLNNWDFGLFNYDVR
jgi:hypothetical protein